MTVKPLTEHHWEFLSLKGGCTGTSESTPVKMPQCWNSHVTAQMTHLCPTSILHSWLKMKCKNVSYTFHFLKNLSLMPSYSESPATHITSKQRRGNVDATSSCRIVADMTLFQCFVSSEIFFAFNFYAVE